MSKVMNEGVEHMIEQANPLHFVGKFASYREMVKNCERAIGNIAVCYTRKHKGNSVYVYNGKRFLYLVDYSELRSNSENGTIGLEDLQLTP